MVFKLGMKLAKMPDGSPEIFHTIQGEGRNTGMPSVFIRSSLCNLHCQWCDTDYTWNWDDTSFPHEKDNQPGYQKHRREDMIITLSEEEIAKRVAVYDCKNFVLTGGEPLIQEKNWVKLMNELGADCHFEIETNGTLLPGEAFIQRINQLNVSPKLSNSGVPEELRLKPDVLAALAKSGKADFKFVIGSKADFTEVEQLVKNCLLPKDRVFLMPKASTPEELNQNQSQVSSLALENGYHYSDRLHLRLYGAKRGV